METTLLLVYLVVGLFALWFATRTKSPWVAMLSGFGLGIPGAFIGQHIKNFGDVHSNSSLSDIGAILVFFFSVAGGAIVSAALTEIRAKHTQKTREQQ